MSYVYLFLAIAGEIIGTSFLKTSVGFSKFWPTLACIVSYAACFFLFSKSLLQINLSIAYATWAGLGVAASLLISVFLFKESISPLGLLGVALVIIGVVLVNLFGGAH